MNAVEKIEAAIERLEEMKAKSTPGPWAVEEIPETGECRLLREFEFFGHHVEEITSGGSIREDADLIVTLHRTVDVQLVILGHALNSAKRSMERGEVPRGPALDLAEAILA
ncbi:hypothetical protein QMG61_05420 [Cryobacterium sp. PH31-AA6]|uniref:hypothetical protein n=1 Tax=Cryobacterium sp. PH31-AA6 TaxID=3046205 RepID=UPI0024BA976A|nr:hypothetical protein [Cryobacterium sp. PH31-AA6]MDJ0323202.1 hypothetical protein [Cryobacterium sp. PH31-AA6]